jgi:predicted nucleotidyltransferase component of viral defense system
MKKRPILDLPRSVRERLVALAHRRGEEPNLVLTRYAAERLLYRLSQTEHQDTFVLKGAMLFAAWSGYPHRPTRDMDLLGFGVLTPEVVRRIFADVCVVAVEADGLVFDPDTVRVEEIREGNEYGGLRVRLVGSMGTSRLPVQVDVGIGDAVVPDPIDIEYPTLLPFPAPRIRAYPPEAVIAEKLHAMVVLGTANSRMKDFFDLATIARYCTVDGALLRNAIAATFARRRSDLPQGNPVALSGPFAAAPEKQTQWNAFVDRSRLPDEPSGLPGVVEVIRQFVTQPLDAARSGAPFQLTWSPGGPWRKEPGGSE